ncbi:MAG TPA: hypothetical protein PKA28_14045 [Methylomusa anaerophila]|nr:hypothetical protein [Methylomusa anaerophila]
MSMNLVFYDWMCQSAKSILRNLKAQIGWQYAVCVFMLVHMGD